jgi:neutral ceramidase
VLRVGFGTGVITPPLPVVLAGFDVRHDPATEVHDDLEARAMVVRVDDVGLCLIVCDLLGMSRGFANPVREAVGAALGLPLAAVLTACTHTHSGPNAMRGGEAMGWPTPEGWLDTLVGGCADAARAADAAAEDGALSFARAPLPDGLSINRRGLPYDPWFSVLDARRPDGTRIGALANVAIHPVALGPECLAVSADWVGPFRHALEHDAGGTALLLSGPLGDVNPGHVHRQYNECEGDGFAEAAELGRGVAEAVGAALAVAEPVDGATGVLDRRIIHAPMTQAGLSPAAKPGDRLEVELVEWELAGVPLVSIPGEAFHAFGRAVDDARGNRALLAGLAPVWQGYLPMPFREGYEESVSYGAPAVAAVLGALVDR